MQFNEEGLRDHAALVNHLADLFSSGHPDVTKDMDHLLAFFNMRGYMQPEIDQTRHSGFALGTVASLSGEQVTYWLNSAEGAKLMSKAADGTGEAVALVESADFLPNSSWSRDGRYLVYQEGGAETNYDIRYVQIEADGSVSEPVTFLSSPASERGPKLSPDGRFVAYSSDDSGRDEINVRPFPDGAGKWQVSVNGGRSPRWRSDGEELYYVEGESLMAVPVSTERVFTRGQPQVLFDSQGLASTSFFGVAHYDVSADGQRIVTIATVEGEVTQPPKIRIVQNWHEEFRDREQ